MSNLQAAPTADAQPPAQARAARLEKFQRQQAIVEYLNRGVSVVEIAARVGVGTAEPAERPHHRARARSPFPHSAFAPWGRSGAAALPPLRGSAGEGDHAKHGGGALAEGHPRWRMQSAESPGEIPAQRLENTQSAPGFAAAPAARPEPASEERPATDAPPRAFRGESREGRLLERDRRLARKTAGCAVRRPGCRSLGAARSGGRRAPGKSAAKPLITLNSRPEIWAWPPGRPATPPS